MVQMLLKHAIDEAFERLGKLYGRQFATLYDESSIDDVKTQWVREISQIPDVLDAIAWAMRNLPERPPNAIQFRNLCRQAPSKQAQAMTQSNAHVRGPTPEELAALHSLRDSIGHRTPSRQWAHDLIAKHERGEEVGGYPLRCAREVAAIDSHVPRGTDPEPMATEKQPMATGKPAPDFSQFYGDDLDDRRIF